MKMIISAKSFGSPTTPNRWRIQIGVYFGEHEEVQKSS